MVRVEIVGDCEVAGHRKPDVISLDPDAVNIPALVAGGHVRVLDQPAEEDDAD